MGYLDNVPEENSFGLSNGRRIQSLGELLAVLKNSDSTLFYSHVNPERNDFANWIKYCIRHEELYDRIVNARQRDEFLRVLEEEIEFIKAPKLRQAAEYFKENPSLGGNANSGSIANNIMDVAAQVPIIQPVPALSASPQPVPSQPDPTQQTQIQPMDAQNNIQNAQPSNMPLAISPEISSGQPPNAAQAASGLIPGFEQVFQLLIVEIEKDILSWDS